MDNLEHKFAKASSSPIRDSRMYFGAYQNIVKELPHHVVDQVVERFLDAYKDGNNIFIFGNGGSAALASHFACDLGKGTVSGKNGYRRFRVMALTDNVPVMTAWANDHSYEDMFAEQLRNFITAGDIAFAISGSGNSPNVLCALELAKETGATTIGLTGFSGGAMKDLCDICVIVPSDNMQVIEDFHVGVTHAIFSVVRQTIADKPHIHRLAAVAAAD